MGATEGNDTESEDACVICLSGITERAITSPCNHYSFDFVCLVSWLQERSTCPLCKTEVAAVQYDWQGPDDFKSYSIRSTNTSSSQAVAYSREPRSLGFATNGLPNRRRCTHRPFSPPADDPALLRRREVYQRGLFSMHVGSNCYSRYRDITAEAIAGDAELQSKARTWIRRELRVFRFLHIDPAGSTSQVATTSSNAEFLLAYIVSFLKMVDIRASNGHAENLLAEFLGREPARLFLHELNAWLRSPYIRLKDWDENVQYKEP
ncbi:RING finger domain protein [Stagonosporopsis vannaccii]|nr:RING finger domain protein [Stagonosporopsis vannaccii]